MNYEKQTWAKGDVVTSAKLNHIEDGIANGGGVLVIPVTYDADTQTATMGKTWQEIYDAPIAVFTMDSEGTSTKYQVGACEYIGHHQYQVRCYTVDGIEDLALTFEADGADGYPYKIFNNNPDD